MTAHELARKLLAGPDAPVHISYPYGDYWRTQAAPQVSRVEEGEITDNPRIDMPRVVTDDDRERNERNDETPEYQTVILIN